MDLIDVTLREGIYCDFGLSYDSALDYLRNFVKYVKPEDVQYVEYVYLNTYEHALLAYDEHYIQEASKILEGFKMVGMMHPGRVDFNEWNDDLIRKFSLVRIVCNGKEIPNIVKDYIDYLHKLDVAVSVNIAYVMSKTEEQIISMYETALAYGADYIYFADSSGSASVYDIAKLCSILKNKRRGNKIGFHLHNHLGLVTANAMQLYLEGIDITDVSITGAGKGAGNLCLETIVPIINKLNNRDISSEKIKNYVDFIDYFNKHVGRKEDNHKFNLIQSLTGLFKLPLKITDKIEEDARGDVHRYIDMVYETLRNQ